jgi:hypothetical protein
MFFQLDSFKNDIYICKNNKEFEKKITENALILHNKYYYLHIPKNDTNKVTNTNGHLFKSTINIIFIIKFE